MTQRVIAVAAGKGGVGKSTVAVNLALGLQRIGLRVGLLDCDVHGPNVPLMLGVRRREAATGWEAIIPVATATGTPIPPLERYGLRVMSLGLLAGENQALLTENAAFVGTLVRGLMSLVDWGELDLLILDLPPGTGEPFATIIQTVNVAGVVLVITPQTVARLDAGRVVAALEAARVPVLGLVENMAYFVCPHCGERLEIFHRGQATPILDDANLPLLAEIPLDPALSEAADRGRPVLISDPEGPRATAFLELARGVSARLEAGSATLSESQDDP